MLEGFEISQQLQSLRCAYGAFHFTLHVSQSLKQYELLCVHSLKDYSGFIVHIVLRQERDLPFA